MIHRVTLIAFILLVYFPAEAFCLDSEEPARNRFYFFLQAGSFMGNNDSGKIKADESGYGYGLGGGYFLTRNLSVEGDFEYFTDNYVRDSATLAPGTSSNDIEIASVSLALNTKYYIRVKTLNFFLGGGVSFYDSDIYVREIGKSGKSNVAGDQSTGYQGIAGIGYSYLDRVHVELAWRRIFLKQDFGIYSNGEVDAGGNYFHIGIRAEY